MIPSASSQLQAYRRRNSGGTSPQRPYTQKTVRSGARGITQQLPNGGRQGLTGGYVGNGSGGTPPGGGGPFVGGGHDVQGGGGQDQQHNAIPFYAPSAQADAQALRDYNQGNIDRGLQGAAIKQQYGYDDHSDPFSKAMLLERAYNQSQSGSLNSYADQGQGYSGALVRAQQSNIFNYGQADDASRREYLAKLADLSSQGTAAGNTYRDTLATDQLNAIQHAPKTDPSEAPGGGKGKGGGGGKGKGGGNGSGGTGVPLPHKGSQTILGGDARQQLVKRGGKQTLSGGVTRPSGGNPPPRGRPKRAIRSQLLAHYKRNKPR